MTLLIVEDNEPMRRLMKKVVADLTDGVTECSDGAEALAAYTQSQPDCVLMDLMMPEVDGISATREIKAAYPDARVVIATDFDDDKLREAASRAGACAYVLKEDLFALRRLLSHKEHE